jgi:hypothetical protein
MSVIKAMLIKDYRTTSKSMKLPVFEIAGIYLIVLCLAIFTGMPDFLKLENILGAKVQPDFSQLTDVFRLFTFDINAEILPLFVGLLYLATILVYGTSLLNTEFRNKSQMFHHSQPVSIWMITGSRFIANIGSAVVLVFVISFINFLVVNAIIPHAIGLPVDWLLAFNGMIIGFIHIAIAILLVGSLCLLFSAIFSSNAFGKALLVLLLLQLFVMGMNYFAQHPIMSPLHFFRRFALGGTRDLYNMTTLLESGIQTQFENGLLPKFSLPDDFLHQAWATVINWLMILKILVVGAFYVLATLIYQKREIRA